VKGIDEGEGGGKMIDRLRLKQGFGSLFLILSFLMLSWPEGFGGTHCLAQEADKRVPKSERGSEDDYNRGDLDVHEPIIKKNKLIKKNVTIRASKYHDKLYFKNCTFTGTIEVVASELLKGVVFDNCIFKKRITFDETKFGREGNETISFINCTFEDDVNFVNCTFFRQTFFQNCRFQGDAIFNSYPEEEHQKFLEGARDNEEKKTVFQKRAYFNKSVFAGMTFFPYVVFEGGVDFTEVVFENRAEFSKAKFRGNTSFARSLFESRADFERAIFYDPQSKGESQRTWVDFYKALFKGDVSFSKAIFLNNVSFKRTRFDERAFFANAFFAGKTDFEMSSFIKEFHASKLNEPGRIAEEIAVYRLNELWQQEKNPDAAMRWKDRYLSEEVNELILLSPRDEERWKNDRIFRLTLERSKEHIVKTVEGWIEALSEGEKNPWAGQTYHMGESTFGILDGSHVNLEDSQFTFNGARFGASVDFRGSWFCKVDFSSDVTVTVFQGPVDFSNVVFRDWIDLRGSVCRERIDLPLDHIFWKTGIVSSGITLLKLGKEDFISGDDLIHLGGESRTNSLKESSTNEATAKERQQTFDSVVPLYENLERLFRKNVQLREASEMAVRAAAFKLSTWKEIFSSLVTFIALPIYNLLLIMGLLIFFSYSCLLFRKTVYGRTRLKEYKPGKLPLVTISSVNSEISEIDLCKGLWRRTTWPFFLCLGSFFALVSLGSEYVVLEKDPGKTYKSCLIEMKILRFAGFIILPLLLYSLAKRSEGLHNIFTIMQ